MIVGNIAAVSTTAATKGTRESANRVIASRHLFTSFFPRSRGRPPLRSIVARLHDGARQRIFLFTLLFQERGFSSLFVGENMSANKNCMDKCVCTRWAFSLQKSFESDQFERLYRRAVQSISEEDYAKVEKFRHKEDSLACLAGRLFLRQAVRRLTGAEWQEIEFGRTERGKPFVKVPEGCDFGINVSHQGDYTVFASSCSNRVGVDVMRLDMDRGGKTADQYIDAMKKSASTEEFKTMKTQANDMMKMTCLKEAVLKATGQGIIDDLSRYDFKIDHSERYRPGVFLTSTTVLLDGKLQSEWVFEESFVDNKHSIAVCREKRLPKQCVFQKGPDTKLFFSKVDFDFLLEGSTILNPLSADAALDYENFMQKPRKKF